MSAWHAEGTAALFVWMICWERAQAVPWFMNTKPSRFTASPSQPDTYNSSHHAWLAWAGMLHANHIHKVPHLDREGHTPVPVHRLTITLRHTCRVQHPVGLQTHSLGSPCTH